MDEATEYLGPGRDGRPGFRARAGPAGRQQRPQHGRRAHRHAGAFPGQGQADCLCRPVRLAVFLAAGQPAGIRHRHHPCHRQARQHAAGDGVGRYRHARRHQPRVPQLDPGQALRCVPRPVRQRRRGSAAGPPDLHRPLYRSGLCPRSAGQSERREVAGRRDQGRVQGRRGDVHPDRRLHVHEEHPARAVPQQSAHHGRHGQGGSGREHGVGECSRGGEAGVPRREVPHGGGLRARSRGSAST